MAKTTKCATIVVIIIASLLQNESAKIHKINALKGEKITFDCDVPKSKPPQVSWMNFVFNTGALPDVMFNSSMNKDTVIKSYIVKGFSMSPTTHELTIDSSIDDSEGKYYCESIVNGTYTVKKSYDLNIINDKPNCTGITVYNEGDEISRKCEFIGTQSINMHPFLDGVPDVDIDRASITFNLLATDKLDGERFECRVENDTRISCDLEFEVKYGVRNVTGPSKEKYVVGDTINCGAKGNPKPELTMLIDDKEVLSEKTTQLSYKLGEDLVKENGILVKCIGREDAGKINPIERVFNITVENKPSEGKSLLGESGNTILIIIIIIIALLLLLILIAFLLYRKRKNSQRQKPKQATLLKSEHRKDYDDSIGA